MDYFTNPDLMNHIFSNGFHCKEYGRALAHLCFMNEKLSKKVCKVIVNGVGSDCTKNYLDALETFVT